MRVFELLAQDYEDSITIYTILPMPTTGIMESEFIKVRETDDGYLKLDFLQTRNRGEGRGAVLLQAATALRKNRNIAEFTGPYGPEPGMSEYVKGWFLRHGIEVINGNLVGKIESSLSMCAQIMSKYDLFYDVVTESRYEQK